MIRNDIDPDGKFYYQTATYSIPGMSADEVVEVLKKNLKAPEWRHNSRNQIFVRMNLDNIAVVWDSSNSAKAVVSTGYSPLQVWNAYMRMFGFSGPGGPAAASMPKSKTKSLHNLYEERRLDEDIL